MRDIDASGTTNDVDGCALYQSAIGGEDIHNGVVSLIALHKQGLCSIADAEAIGRSNQSWLNARDYVVLRLFYQITGEHIGLLDGGHIHLVDSRSSIGIATHRGVAVVSTIDELVGPGAATV